MPIDPSRSLRSRIPPSILLVAITAVLYFGRELLIPLAVAVLLAFLLGPAVAFLERRGCGRVCATAVVVACSFSVIGSIGWIAGNQLIGLAESLPRYKDNIASKVEALRTPSNGSLGRAAVAIRDLGTELGRAATPAARPEDRRHAALPVPSRARAAVDSPAGGRPMPVEVVSGPLQPLERLGNLVSPLLAPLGTAAAVVVFTVLMLLQREDLRDRLIRLAGQGRINLTTQAIEEAAQRVSRYLRMQMIVNLSYGVPVGIALHLLGLPNAALWGLLATVLRFVPYVGAWIAAAFPIALAFAVGEDWSLVLWTVGLFITLELASNNVLEPWLYGASTGLSAFAVITSALFWTWLWGPMGLLLATPLTVCVLVIGRHIPQLAFLDVILGDEPVLAPPVRLYQRLLAGDEAEAAEVVETYLREHPPRELYDLVLLPALALAENDRHREALDEERERSFLEGMRRIVELVAQPPAPGAVPGGPLCSPAAPDLPPGTRTRPGVCILPARNRADGIATALLADLLVPQPYELTLLPERLLVGETIDRIGEAMPAVVCISAVPPLAVMHVGSLCKRLKARFPDMRILVASWDARGEIESVKARLAASGMDRFATTLEQAEAQIRELAMPAALAVQAPRCVEATGA